MLLTILFYLSLICISSSAGWPRSVTVDDTCVGRCGDGYDSAHSCQCNSACHSHQDCCSDYDQVCDGESCRGRCSDGYLPDRPCQCNPECGQHNNCCPDYDEQCGSSDGLSDADLMTLSEMLVKVDDNNVADKVVLDYGCRTNSGNDEDCSPNPLFKSVSESVFVLPTFSRLIALYDNYNSDVGVVEDHNQEERREEEEFINEVAATRVMETTYEFLHQKGVFPGTFDDWKSYLTEIWFTVYDRARRTLGSSGFEHVFIGEKKRGEVGGFHSWVHYHWLEEAGEINYLGYWQTAQFQEKGSGISMTFKWGDEQKPYGSMFIGTSPELDLALYTTCFLTRPDAKCHLTLEGTDVFIQTWTFSQGGKVLVGSSYPDWENSAEGVDGTK